MVEFQSVEHAQAELAIWNDYNRHIRNDAKKFLAGVEAGDIEAPEKTPVDVVVEEPKEEVKKYSSADFYDMNKSEQVALLKEWGYSIAIPKYEEERVNALMRLQRKR